VYNQMKKITIPPLTKVLTSLFFFSTVSITVLVFGCSSDARLEIAGSVSFVLRNVPGGTFPTGIDDDGGYQKVGSFWMGEAEVTYELWNEVYVWALSNGYNFANAGTMGWGSGVTNQHPVVNVNWHDAVVWCNALSEMAGLIPVYVSLDVDVYVIVRDSRDTNAAECDRAIAVSSASGYRLPEMVEWECAARYLGTGNPGYGIESPDSSGTYWTPGNFASGARADVSEEDATGRVGWYLVNSAGSTHAVKRKTPNALGLYDMSGNVWEICSSLYFGTAFLVRGGSWNEQALFLMIGYDSYYNFALPPESERNYIGFRIVRTR
jgi:formylglycine-generating enzyme required for sulfatase activity